MEIEDIKSNMLNISTGVPEGSILGPLLFIYIYIYIYIVLFRLRGDLFILSHSLILCSSMLIENSTFQFSS